VAGVASIGDTPRPEPDSLVLTRTLSEGRPTRGSLRALMWNRAGILRDRVGLERARTTLERWAQEDGGADVASRETANLALVGWAMGVAAGRREESRGAHPRLDFSEPSERWRRRQHFVLASFARTATADGAVPAGLQVRS